MCATIPVVQREQDHGPADDAVPLWRRDAGTWDRSDSDALEELKRVKQDVRIINLETAITTSDDFWPGKGIHYRMHPGNVRTLTAAKIDCCTLANNHVLDWGYTGLAETLRTLRKAGIATTGVGEKLDTASAPAVIPSGKERQVLVFAFGSPTSGVPGEWAATDDRAGGNYLPSFSHDSLDLVVTKGSKATTAIDPTSR